MVNVMSPQEAATYLCSKSTLIDFLDQQGDAPMVLIIDELNVLLQPKQGETYFEVGEFLREQWLDKPRRHLVVSSHIPTPTGIEQIIGNGSGTGYESHLQAGSVPLTLRRFYLYLNF
eukprot:4315076-Amphidinium_carterae.1